MEGFDQWNTSQVESDKKLLFKSADNSYFSSFYLSICKI